jgi:hypothetical protein
VESVERSVQAVEAVECFGVAVEPVHALIVPFLQCPDVGHGSST